MLLDELVRGEKDWSSLIVSLSSPYFAVRTAN